MTNLVSRSYRPVRTGLADFLGLDARSFSGGFGGFDIHRSEQGYTVEIPVPGFKPEEIEATLEENVLTVTGKSQRRQFSRSLVIPEEIDAENIQAKVEHGMLNLTLNVHPKAAPRKIAIAIGEGTQSSVN